ncbi:MAG: hypothetical protein ACI8TX_001600 [Hyphomicrobiaceae bacterium]
MNSFQIVFALSLFLVATPAHATVTIWENVCSEGQVNNSGVGDGSTDSTATGHSDIRYEDTTDELSWNISYTGLEADLTAIHVHGPAIPSESAGPHLFNVFTGEPDVVASGLDRRDDAAVATVDFSRQVVDTGSGDFGPAAVAAFMQDEMGYTNIHSAMWPLGEIRCNLVKTGDFEPQTKGQKKCLLNIEKTFAQLMGKGAKSLLPCVKASTKTDPIDSEAGQACEDGPFTTKVNKIVAKADIALSKFCIDDDAPTLGVPVDPVELSDIVLGAAPLAQLPFLGTVASGIAPEDYSLAAGKCMFQALKGANKCYLAAYKEYAVCAKKGRAGKLGVSFVSPFDFAKCVQSDPKGRVAKACNTGSTLEKKVLKHCGDGISEVALAFGVADAQTSAATTGSLMRCLSCRVAMFTSLQGLIADGADESIVVPFCEIADDGLDNASCLGF